jgi:hypothetical protein
MPSDSLPSRLNQFRYDTLGCANAGELDILNIPPKDDSFTNDPQQRKRAKSETNKPVEEWSVQDVLRWLKEHNLSSQT